MFSAPCVVGVTCKQHPKKACPGKRMFYIQESEEDVELFDALGSVQQVFEPLSHFRLNAH